MYILILLVLLFMIKLFKKSVIQFTKRNNYYNQYYNNKFRLGHRAIWQRRFHVNHIKIHFKDKTAIRRISRRKPRRRLKLIVKN